MDDSVSDPFIAAEKRLPCVTLYMDSKAAALNGGGAGADQPPCPTQFYRRTGPDRGVTAGAPVPKRETAARLQVAETGL